MGLATLAAGAVLKGAMSLLDSLTDEQRQRLKYEVTELSAAIKTTTVALAAQHANKKAQAGVNWRACWVVAEVTGVV